MASMASNIPQEFLNINAENELYYRIVWLDKSLEHYYNQRILTELKEIDPAIESFTCEKQCIDYIRLNENNTTSLIIFIISGSLSKKIISKIHDCKYILGFFIFCKNSEDYAHVQFPKLRAVYDDKRELIDVIETYIARENIRQIGFSLLNNQQSTSSESTSTNDQYPIRNLKEDEKRFLWFYQWHTYLIKLENNDDLEAKNEMISCCREEFKNNNRAQSAIDDFNAQSLTDNAQTAIEWYTKSLFLYYCVNIVLRKEKISHVYSYRYIIKLLCRQLENEHKEYIKKYRKEKGNAPLRLYRGQQFQPSELALFETSINSFISLNGFVSTTLERDIAVQFLHRRKKVGLIPVLFEIDVDMTSEQGIAFADISKLSKYPEEEEILLSIGSIFRIESVKYDRHRQLHKIRLSLSQLEQLTVNKYIKHTYGDDANSVDRLILFGKLLFEMGEYKLALKHFIDTNRRLSDGNNHIQATYLNNIGMCYNGLGKGVKAFKYYEKAIEIYREANNHRGIGLCYHNMAGIYLAEMQHDLAFIYALDALENREQYPLERASTFDLLGCIYLAKRDPEAARHNFQDSLTIRLKHWNEINPNHPDIGSSYQNLGGVDSRVSRFIDAHDNYSRAAEIYRHNYPTSHPLMENITKSLKDAKKQLRH